MTQKKIAEMFNISQPAVSLLLNDPETKAVSREKKRRIFEYINRDKSFLAKQNEKNIGFVVSDDILLGSNPAQSYYRRFYYGLLNRCNELGLHLTTHNKGIDSLLGDSPLIRVGGLVVLERVKLVQLKELLRRYHVVLLNSEVEELVCDIVMPDDRTGTESVVSYLKSRGHVKIGFFGISAAEGEYFKNIHFYNRLQGFRQGVEKNGLESGPGLVRIFPAVKKNFAEMDGYAEEAAGSWARHGFPTAVVTGDFCAASLLKAAQRLGYGVPGDFSIVGYDNKDFCELVNPRLTSVDQHMAEMAAAGLGLLADRMRGHGGPPKKLLCATEIIERDSVSDLTRKYNDRFLKSMPEGDASGLPPLERRKGGG